MNSALLIIDVQKALFETQPGPANANFIIDNINSLSSNARKVEIPVIFVQHETVNSILDFESSGWVLDPRLHVSLGDHKIRKTTPDSFQDTNLHELLTTLDITKLVICGYATEFCIDTTIRRAAALGYQIIIAADGHTTHDKQHMSADMIRIHHNATLTTITSFDSEIKAVKSSEIEF